MTTSTDRSAEPGSAAGAEASLLGFLASRTKKDWDADTDLFASGGLSSLFAMELVVYLEETFDIEIAGADLRLDNFRTVTRMVSLVRRLAGSGSA
ncbi:acyl carrier protein [Kibdelosporangium persicum]|uniref:D-alanine--poly(Phosphoribitol) ligase subunit 2 n=1 Tax=Kibdelosporangium persicum TaxID=2698649 RepID=A0ABX2FIV4_9PSEU|nr:acyl carrier protein [Kibdelosporangium persicum]NRN71348.1 D-alanine--poly(Phosphoribitol) ligase subunit 2 [Kibdelosporangium persicum]